MRPGPPPCAPTPVSRHATLGALLLACTLALTACATMPRDASTPGTAPTPTTSAPEAASDEASTSTPTPTPTTTPPADWPLTTVNEQADCDLLVREGALVPLNYWPTPNDDFDTMLITANGAGLLERSAGSCWADSEVSDRAGFFVGSTGDGGVIDGDAFEHAIFTPPGGGYVEVPYETETYGAGYVYFVDAECYSGRCAVCHYVEDDVMISHSRPADGECRTTLYALVDTLRG